ncbi:Nitrate reductase (NADH) [Hordeum vulgare]|nr:Nitrate reductase (NADH) [Hordeum vulgare]
MHRLPRLFCCWEFVHGRLVLADHNSVKRRAEELGPLAFKLKDDTGELCGGVIGPEDYLLPGQKDHLMRAIMERSVREAAEDATHNLRKLDIEQIFLEQGVTASQASTSKEADLCVLKAEQDKIWIDLDSTSDED